MGGLTIREVKREIRVLGIDSAVVEDGYVDYVGVVFRGGLWLDGVMQVRVGDAETDVAGRVADMILQSPHYGQIRVIMLSTSVTGQCLDTGRLTRETRLPVILVSEETGEIQGLGIDGLTARKVVDKTCTFSDVPEPLRVARLLANCLKDRGKV